MKNIIFMIVFLVTTPANQITGMNRFNMYHPFGNLFFTGMVSSHFLWTSQFIKVWRLKRMVNSKRVPKLRPKVILTRVNGLKILCVSFVENTTCSWITFSYHSYLSGDNSKNSLEYPNVQYLISKWQMLNIYFLINIVFNWFIYFFLILFDLYLFLHVFFYLIRSYFLQFFVFIPGCHTWSHLQIPPFGTKSWSPHEIAILARSPPKSLILFLIFHNFAKKYWTLWANVIGYLSISSVMFTYIEYII